MSAYLGVLFLLYGLANSVCYYPNGDTTPGDMPCDDSKPHSACCGIGYACLSNNICMKNRPSNEQRRDDDYSRGSCTDITWRSSSCPNFCARGEAPYHDIMEDGNGMAKCPGTSLDMYFCIDADSANVDCVNQVNVLVFPGTPSILTTIGVTNSRSSSTSSFTTSRTLAQVFNLSQQTATSSSTPSSSFSSASSPTSSSFSSSFSSTSLAATSTYSSKTVPSSVNPAGLVTNIPQANPKPTNNATAIGIGIGTGAAVVILGLVGVLLYRMYGRKAKHELDNDGAEGSYQDVRANRGHLSIAKSELPAYEPCNNGDTYELQGNHYSP